MLAQGKEGGRHASTVHVCFINSSCLLWSDWVNRQTDILITAKGRGFISSRLALTAGKSRYRRETSLAFTKVFVSTERVSTSPNATVQIPLFIRTSGIKFQTINGLKRVCFFLIVTNFYKHENRFPVGRIKPLHSPSSNTWRTRREPRPSSGISVSSSWKPCWKSTPARGSLPAASSLIRSLLVVPFRMSLLSPLSWTTMSSTHNHTSAVYYQQSCLEPQWLSPQKVNGWKMRRTQKGKKTSCSYALNIVNDAWRTAVIHVYLVPECSQCDSL